MLWEIEILPLHQDPERERVGSELRLLTHGQAENPVDVASRGYLLEGLFGEQDAKQILNDLLLDPLVETGRVGRLNAHGEFSRNGTTLWPVATVLLKPGVMDPVAESVIQAGRDLGIALDSVRTFRRYYADAGDGKAGKLAACPTGVFHKVLANDAIEQVVEGPLHVDHLTLDQAYAFRKNIVGLRELDDDGLMKLSKEGQLALNLAEMKTIQAHFREQRRDPTDVELETIAQTWSEHCSHKTLKGQIEFRGKRYQNLLKETIFGATQEIRARLGKDDWCVSVFEDNAGVVRFNEQHHVCFKVETHNHPSALEPYGGANTGLGGVIRDVLGTALGAKPVCNTDVFCFAPPQSDCELPPGVLHPRKVMHGVVAGVRDYGNRMGIPTVNGAVCFDERYLGNPLVYCGTVGLLPVARAHKQARPGDLIVAVGGRTGRDGIHGATFSSIELTSESETISGGAVQIGNAITEKKVMDVLLEARDRGLYSAVTDCGAGGFSSAVGEMGEKIGARVDLEKAPLKYAGLSYTEIWISEAQERMVLAVPPDRWPELQKLCAGEDVEAVALGTFEPTGRLRLFYQGAQVADLEMKFLHDGRPPLVRKATWEAPKVAGTLRVPSPSPPPDFNEVLHKLLASPNICSKEWIIRQYDHEVQGGSVIKPLVGVHDDGPSDAAVVQPVLGDPRGIVIGCGINPRYGDLDPYRMAALAIDEAVRNVVAVGADPRRIALLDNFCWGNTERPEVLGSLVLAAEACRDVSLAYQMPFISGKDSLNNEFKSEGKTIVIPPTLLISALGQTADVRLSVSMDFKEPGNLIVLVGITAEELGGSHYHLVTGRSGGEVPQVDKALAPLIFIQIHRAMQQGWIRSCHDLSEGGLAVALAEMAFAGMIGADVLPMKDDLSDEAALFSESATRFLLEVRPGDWDRLRADWARELPFTVLGQTTAERRLRIAGASGEWIVWAALDQLKESWQTTLRG